MQVKDMLYKWKDAFCLRDEIGTSPNMRQLISYVNSLITILPLDHIMLKRKIKMYWKGK